MDNPRILIIKMPKGAEPLPIRQQWVGKEFPCELLARRNPRKLWRKPVYHVPQKAVMEIMAEECPDLVAYWRAKGLPKEGEYFYFEEDEAKVVRGHVPRQKLILYIEEVSGQPSRSR